MATTFLDPSAYPAHDLALTYHERWDIEEAYDEMETHLIEGNAPLQSRSVTGSPRR